MKNWYQFFKLIIQLELFSILLFLEIFKKLKF